LNRLPRFYLRLNFMAKESITAVIMVNEPAAIPASPVGWTQNARRAAARDLLAQLAAQPLISEIILVAPEPAALQPPPGVNMVVTPPGPIHFGEQLSAVIRAHQIEKLIYFGGGSAPLLPAAVLTQLLEQLNQSERILLTNNRFASDWAAVAPAHILLDWAEKLPQDNMLGWVLSQEAGLPCTALPASAASRLDIDTPTDLLTLRLHPQTPPHLAAFLADLPLDDTPLRRALAVLATPASRVFIAGRFAPAVWTAVNKATQCWLRVISEERGMVSSGRQARGEVYSLLADHIELIGPDAFFAKLAQEADAAFIDSRPLIAHHQSLMGQHGRWPSDADRFASDLGLAERIEDEWLRAFTMAAVAAPLPVILGGHSLLAGDMFAFCDLI
jgi:CTP:molybdopterin cytidylyltransferase MocA